MDTQANQKSALGVEGNIAALLGYLIVIVAIISIFLEKENRFVRFHAIQATIWSVVGFVGVFVLMFVMLIVGGVVTAINQTLGSLVFLLLMLVFSVFGLALGVGGIFSAVKAFQGEKFKLPVVGNIAEKYANS